MALTTQPKRAQFVQTIGLSSAPIVTGHERASQTFVAGAFLIDDEGGRVTPSTSPIDASSVAKRTIGMALAPAIGTTSADIPIALAGPYTVFEGTLSDATAGTHTLAQADMWLVYPPTKGTTHWYLDAAAVSDTGGGLVIGLKDAIGTVDGRVYFIVTTPARGGTNAGSANW